MAQMYDLTPYRRYPIIGFSEIIDGTTVMNAIADLDQQYNHADILLYTGTHGSEDGILTTETGFLQEDISNLVPHYHNVSYRITNANSEPQRLIYDLNRQDCIHVLAWCYSSNWQLLYTGIPIPSHSSSFEVSGRPRRHSM
jgi:hypothetical protein